MIFYAFSEEEIVDTHRRLGILDDLKIAAKYAYKNRLPKRINPTTDGTTGEVLLDILIQVYEPLSHKLITRAKFQQLGDNTEIKGYDALYFTKYEGEISLWLGQIKTGSCAYCKSSIGSDLDTKYVSDYFSDAMYYIADKADKNNPLTDILNKINEICFESIKNKWTSEQKKGVLLKLLESWNVKIIIPCVLVFTAEIYSDVQKLQDEIVECTNEVVEYFDDKVFKITAGLNYEIIYYVFPVNNVKELREKISVFKKD